MLFMKNVLKNPKKSIIFTIFFVAFLHYSFDSEAKREEIGGICNGQHVKVVKTTFLFWSWYHVEDANNQPVNDDCNLIDQAKERI